MKSRLENRQIFLYVLSDNGWHSRGQKYSDSLQAIWRLLGPTSMWVDNFHEDDFQSGKVLENLKFFIRLVAPDIILCPSPNDSNPQRREVAKCVVEVSEMHSNILAYELPDTADFCPTVYTDISETLGTKLELCKALFGDEVQEIKGANALARSRTMGLGDDAVAAEAFEVISYHFSRNFDLENIVSKLRSLPAEMPRRPGYVIEYASINSIQGKPGA